MLRLTTTRIILGFICFESIRFTGRPRPSTTPLRHSLFWSKSHKTVDEFGRTSNRSCSVMHLSPWAHALVLALRGPTVPRWSRLPDDVGELWRGPLLSSHRRLCHLPPLPSPKKPVTGCFDAKCTHARTQTSRTARWKRPLSSGGPEATRLCVWYEHVEHSPVPNDSLSESLQYFSCFDYLNTSSLEGSSTCMLC